MKWINAASGRPSTSCLKPGAKKLQTAAMTLLWNLACSFYISVGQRPEDFQAGNVYVVVADLNDYIETIQKDRLMLHIDSHVPEVRMLKLITILRRSIPVSAISLTIVGQPRRLSQT
ncbi:MAG: hypothetical protein R3C17_13260 [Planctomycetaceae bacterium]